MDIEAKTIDRIFKALNDQIIAHKGHPFSIVVCGGAALIAMGLIKRKTKDVDILGEIEENSGKINIKKILYFPSWLIRAVYSVSIDLNMPDNWFNAGPAQQLDYGLPSGFESRLERISYGEYLNVYFTSRIDQIFFKLNHSICVGGAGQQVDDLFNLKPTLDELSQACNWVLNQYKSANIQETLLNFFKERNIKVSPG